MKTQKAELPVLSFKSSGSFREWLSENHSSPTGIWLRIYKVKSGIATVTYAEALDVALCFGWIDGQKNTFDDDSWIQKFTPRRPRSLWSKKNREHVERLTQLGFMQPSGVEEVEAAKADGRWDKAYDSQSTMVIPSDFLKELSKHKKAEAFFQTLNKTNVFAIVWRLQTAKKPETRERRMNAILDKLKKGEKIH